MKIENNILIADKGKVLTNGTDYFTKVHISNLDSANNYKEIDETEIINNEVEL